MSNKTNSRIVEEVYETFNQELKNGNYNAIERILGRLIDDGFSVDAETLAEMCTPEERRKFGWDCAYDEIAHEK